MPKINTVYYFTANKNENIVSLIKNGHHDDSKFCCYGTGNKAYKQACKNVKDNELVHQVKIEAESIKLLYSY